MMKHVFLSLGSNMGRREVFLQEAIFALDKTDDISIYKVSSIYETEPVGFTRQNKFLNMAVEVQTALSPMELLKTTQQVELKLGRKRTIKWGPRTIDIDILLYDQLIIETEWLTIPHPRMMSRAFVLIPLFDLNPKLRIPTVSRPLAECVEEIPDKVGVQLWKQNNGEGKYGLFVS